MKCKCGNETSDRWCGKCGLKMPLGPGDRLLERTEGNLKANQETSVMLAKALAPEDLDEAQRKTLAADKGRVET